MSHFGTLFEVKSNLKKPSAVETAISISRTQKGSWKSKAL